MSGTKHERAIEAAVRAVMETNMPFWRGVGGLGAVLPTAIAAYQRAMREPGPDEVRVRVCVAICDDPEIWGAAGWNAEDSDLRDASCEGMDDREVQHRWIEATVPAWCPPAEEPVEGEVVE